MATHRFQTPGPVALEIKVPIGEIDVETVDGGESTIEIEGNDRLVEQTDVRQEGDRIVVELRKKSFGITISIGDFSFGGAELHVRARIPHSSRAEIATASGDAAIRGRVRELDVKSASGDTALHGEVDGDAKIKSVSGDVRLDHIRGDLYFQTVSGDFAVRSVGHSVEGKSVSGDVRIDAVREGTVSIQSVSGDIEVGVESNTNLDVDAGSVSGDLSSEVPLGSDPGEATEEGPTLVLRGKTISGDFRVFRAHAGAER
jgi:hypothetical protein